MSGQSAAVRQSAIEERAIPDSENARDTVSLEQCADSN